MKKLFNRALFVVIVAIIAIGVFTETGRGQSYGSYSGILAQNNALKRAIQALLGQAAADDDNCKCEFLGIECEND